MHIVSRNLPTSPHTVPTLTHAPHERYKSDSRVLVLGVSLLLCGLETHLLGAFRGRVPCGELRATAVIDKWVSCRSAEIALLHFAMALFPEEQLDSPLGYFPAQPGQQIKNGTWTINRKLGWGPRSSTWLVIDKNDQYRALKILTVAATADPKAKNEIYFLHQPVQAGRAPDLLETFEEKDEQGRKHLCLLFRLLGTSVEDLRQGNVYHGQNLPVHIVQKVIGDILGCLVNLATENVIHGGRSN